MSTKQKHKAIQVNPDGSLSINLMPHQLAAYNSKKQIAGIVGSRGCGKTIYMSVEAFLEILNGRRVLLMAQNYKSLKVNIFREIVERFREAGLEPDVSYGDMSIKYGRGELYGFTYESIDSTRGLTQISLLLLDELAYAPPGLLATVAPCLRGAGGSRIRFGTSPKKGSIWNRWFKSTEVDKDIFTATMFQNTELDQEDYDLQINAIKDEMQYRQEVMGEILDDDVEFGIIKWNEYPKIKKIPQGKKRLGIDCSGSGADYNVFIVADSSSIIEKVKIQVANTFEMFSTAKELIDRYGISIVNVDCTGGFGNGVTDMIRDSYRRLEVNGVNFGQKAVEERFLNCRAEMYFNLADKIREGFYVDDDSIKEELQYVTYEINTSGKTYLVSKSEIKELIGRSPDSADALALALYDPNPVKVLSPADSLHVAMQFVSI